MTPYSIIRIALVFVIEFIYAINLPRILTMRSNAVFYTVRAVDVIGSSVLREMGLNVAAFFPPLFYLLDIGIPIALSIGNLSERAAKTVFVSVDRLIIELLGAAVYALLNRGSIAPDHIDASNVTSVVFVYLLITVAFSVLIEITVAVCARIDGSPDASLGTPAVLLILGATFPPIISNARLFMVATSDTAAIVAKFVFVLLSLTGAYLILVVTRREATSQREAADAALAARKAKHTLSEVEGLSWRAEGMYALRHALAGEARAVGRLAAAGEADEAARRLDDLRAQAHVLTGGSVE